MGRILEALKQAELGRAHRAEAGSAAPPYQPPCQQETTEVNEAGQEPEAGETLEDGEGEVPFIEVGGPRSTLEASPSVLAASPIRPNPAVPAPAIPLPAPEPEAPVALRPATVTVAFRPWPEEPPPLPPPGRRFAPELVTFHQPDHPVSEQYRGLLRALIKPLPAGRPLALLLTAAGPGTGTTNTLLNLAITAAFEEKKRVALVDANVSSPALAQRLGLPTAPGLQEVLGGFLSLQRALRETGLTNLVLLSAGEVGPIAGGRLAGEAMRSVLRHLRTRFDLVLVDGPPWDGRPDVVALGAFCDGIYLVVSQDRAKTPETANLLQVMLHQGGQVRGYIVTNRP